MMEYTFRIFAAEEISGPVTVIEDKLFSQSTKILSCSEIAEYIIWPSQFYKESSNTSRALIKLGIEVHEPE